MGSTPWRQERQFGVSVGLVLLAAALWFAWRGRSPLVIGIPGALGSALLLFGLAFPRALEFPNKWWMRLAEALSWLSTRVILGLLFVLVLAPLGAWRRMLGKDPLARRAPADRPSYWHPYSARQRDPRHYERMF